jgi:hypothetical protein
MDPQLLIQTLDAQRRAQGLLTVQEVLALAERNTVLDPFSLIVGQGVDIGEGNVFFPQTVFMRGPAGRMHLGDGNHFLPGFLAWAQEGSITVGHRNRFGEGPVSLRTHSAQDCIAIGDEGRYMQGVSVSGRCQLGSGSQLLGGPLTLQDCTLAAGGSHLEPDPDARGAVIKGQGIARQLTLARGEVLNGRVLLDTTPIERQSAYHPRPDTR